MAYANFKKEIWSEMITRELEKDLVFGALVNRQFEGEIKHGGVVHIARAGAATVKDYTGADIAFETPAGGKQAIAIDHAKYTALTFDDVDQVQSIGALKSVEVEDAIYRMADEVDTAIGAVEAKVKATNRVAVDITAGTPGSGEVLQGLYSVNRKLNEANVPHQGRFIVITPLVEEALLGDLSYKNFPQTDELTAVNGYVGRLAGLEIFVSNNVATTADTDKCLAGSKAGMTLAMQLTEIEPGRHEKRFADYVKMLNLYGVDVLETETGFTNRLATLDVKHK